MGYIDKCKRCYGSGKTWAANAIGVVRQIKGCDSCGGTGKGKPYRVKPNLSDGAKLGWNEMPSWPRFGSEGSCEGCSAKLTGRKTRYCSRGCRIAVYGRLWHGIHWQKRAIAVRDGCACRACGEVYESPVRPGGPSLPMAKMLQLDHVRPLSRGGDESPANCQLLCEACHKIKTRRERGAA